MRSSIQRTQHHRPRTQTLAAAGLMVLSSTCGLAQPAITPAQQACAAAEALLIVGLPYSPELAEQARRAAGARELRKIEPGRFYTMEFSPNRLNIEIDRFGIVTDVRCG